MAAKEHQPAVNIYWHLQFVPQTIYYNVYKHIFYVPGTFSIMLDRSCWSLDLMVTV